jgi:5-hydroxyisourate hydrolase
MPGISIHVVDVAHGQIAAGLRVQLFVVKAASGETEAVAIADGHTTGGGQLDCPVLAAHFAPGEYEARFFVADYYRAAGVALPAVPFLNVVRFRFGIADTAQHYHLPMKLTPWGLSCFRGGA